MSVPYLISSLPALSMDAPPPLTPEAFKDECARILSSDQAAVVAALVDGTPCSHPFVLAWRDLDTQIRNAIVRRRAARRGVDPLSAQRPAEGCNLRVIQAAESAFDQPDPLKRQRAIDKARWDALDELVGPQPLSFEAVLAYAVRLGIAGRWAKYDQAAGDEFLKGLARQSVAGALGE